MIITMLTGGGEEQIESLENAARRHTQAGDVFRRLLNNKLGMIGLCIVIVLLFLTIFSGVVTKFPYEEQDFGNRFQFPDPVHIMGTALLAAVTAALLIRFRKQIFGNKMK